MLFVSNQPEWNNSLDSPFPFPQDYEIFQSISIQIFLRAVSGYDLPGFEQKIERTQVCNCSKRICPYKMINRSFRLDAIEETKKFQSDEASNDKGMN